MVYIIYKEQWCRISDGGWLGGYISFQSRKPIALCFDKKSALDKIEFLKDKNSSELIKYSFEEKDSIPIKDNGELDWGYKI